MELRAFHRLAAVASSTLAATLGLLWSSQAEASNYLVIIADDLGVDKVGAYNEMFDSLATDPVPPLIYDTTEAPNLPATPNIDQLAAGGRRFTKAWATPVCSPTRAALNTGMYPHRNGVTWALGANAPGLVTGNFTTLADQMGGVGGLATGLFGKWHIGTTGTAAVNWTTPGAKAADTHVSTAGYTRFYGSLEGEVADYNNWTRVSDTNVVNNATVAVETGWVSTQTVSNALSWIQNRNSDWFAVVSFNLPHADTDGSWDFGDVPLSCVPVGSAVRPCIAAGQLNLADPACTDEDWAVYQAMVECLDTKIGDLLNGIETYDAAMLEDTVIVFVGDNGTPSNVSEYPFDAAGGRGKATPYETGIRVPLIIADGGAWTGGASPLVTTGDVTMPIHVLDLYNTLIVHATGTPVAGTDSESYADCLTTGGGSCGRPMHAMSNYTEAVQTGGAQQKMAAVMYGDYKLIIEDGGACLTEELFDIDDDYFEMIDLITTNLAMRDVARDVFADIAPDWAFDAGGVMIDPWCVP